MDGSIIVDHRFPHQLQQPLPSTTPGPQKTERGGHATTIPDPDDEFQGAPAAPEEGGGASFQSFLPTSSRGKAWEEMDLPGKAREGVGTRLPRGTNRRTEHP